MARPRPNFRLTSRSRETSVGGATSQRRDTMPLLVRGGIGFVVLHVEVEGRRCKSVRTARLLSGAATSATPTAKRCATAVTAFEGPEVYRVRHAVSFATRSDRRQRTVVPGPVGSRDRWLRMVDAG